MFDFKVDHKITREFLLSKNNEETYMSYYLGLPVKKGLYRNPLRNDNHVTCSFYRGKSGNLYFKDFATGKSLTFEGVVMERYGVSYYEALKIIANDFGLGKYNTKPKVPIKIQPVFKKEESTSIRVEIKDFSEQELKWWNNFGVTKNILNKFHIYSCKTVFLNGNIFAQSSQHCPIYGYYFGKKENIEQWKIYFPNRKEFRFINNLSSKTIQGFKQLPKSGKLLVITKSQKDLMCLYSLGIPAIAPNSENIFISNDLYEKLKQRFKYIVLLYDCDLTGVRFTNKIRKQYKDLLVAIIPRKYEAKDISDFYKKYGKDKTIKLIKEYLTSIKHEELD